METGLCNMKWRFFQKTEKWTRQNGQKEKKTEVTSYKTKLPVVEASLT